MHWCPLPRPLPRLHPPTRLPRSNRVLAHLPYMIALDHAKRAVVLAIRWGACCCPGAGAALVGEVEGSGQEAEGSSCIRCALLT